VKSAFLSSNGCPENLIDTTRVKTYLEQNGWHIADDPAGADLILFNACGLTSGSANESLDIIKELQEQARDDSQVIVWGCLPKIDLEALRQVYQGPALGERDSCELDEIIHAVKPIDEITSNELSSRYQCEKRVGWEAVYELPIRLLTCYHLHLGRKVNLRRPNDPSFFYIKISTGCVGNCAYCAVRKSRGQIKSKPIHKVMDEFREGLSRGYMNFSLLGTDLGPQGRDLGYTLVDLLEEMVREKGDYRIGLRNVHPHFLKEMLSDLEPVLSTGKIWYMGIPAESGSDRILKLMGRNYTAEDVRECVQRVRTAYSDLVIRTQFMVGFPTETKQDFADSMRLLDRVMFDHVEVYRFSPRPGTRAEKMEGQVPSRVALFREYRMIMKTQVDAVVKTLISEPLHKIPRPRFGL